MRPASFALRGRFRALAPLPLVLAAWALALTVAACSEKGDGGLPPDEVELVPFPGTRLLAAADLAALVESTLDGRLTFAPAPAALAAVARGDVLVGGLSPATPAGLLRVVKSAAREGDRLVLTTLHAPLALAFRKVHARVAREVADLGTASYAPASAAVTLRQQAISIGGEPYAEKPIDFLLFDGDGDRATRNDQIAVEGAIGGGFRWDLRLDVDWGSVLDLPAAVEACVEQLLSVLEGELPDCSLAALLPEVKATFDAYPRVAARARVVGSASLAYEKKLDLASTTLPPIPLAFLVFVPTVTLTAELEGTAVAGFSVAARGQAVFSTGVTGSSKQREPQIRPLRLESTDFDSSGTELALSASLKVGMGARLDVGLYGVTGPYAEARAYAAVEGNVLRSPCWRLRLGIDADLGVRVTTPALPILGAVTLLDWQALSLTPIDQEASSGPCLPVPQRSGPPGSGPDAERLATPTFTPWTHLYAGGGEDASVRTPTGDGTDWVDLQPAIDGRQVAVGRRQRALLKLDDAGALTWARAYRPAADANLLRLVRLVPTDGATMLVLTAGAPGELTSLLEVDQAGRPLRRVTLALPAADCAGEAVALARAGAVGAVGAPAGYHLAIACPDDQRTVLVRVAPALDAAEARVVSDASGRRLSPRVVQGLGAGPVLLGQTSLADEGARLFALRLDGQGTPVYGHLYGGCPDTPELSASAATPGADGQLTLVGSAVSHRVGLLARLRGDGTVAFAGFPGIGAGASKVFVLNAFAELPTTGFVVAASTVDLLAPAGSPEATPTLAVAGLDVVGRPLWGRRYVLPGNRAAGFPGLRLTDDGGVVLAALAERAAPAANAGALLTLKVHAKDGTAAANPAAVASPMALAAEPCTVTSTPWAPTLTPTRATLTAAPVLLEPAAVTPE